MLSSSAKLLVGGVARRAVPAAPIHHSSSSSRATTGSLWTASRSLSTALRPKQSRPEELTVLKLNMLQDNPGAIKKVRDGIVLVLETTELQ